MLSTASTQKTTFDRAGYVTTGRLLPADELATLSARVQQIASGAVPFQGEIHFAAAAPAASPRSARITEIRDVHLHDEVLRAFCLHPLLLDLAASVFECDAQLYAAHLHMKPAHHGPALPWHRDYSHWRHQRPDLATCWLALDDATISNGCLRVIPGSHRDTPCACDEKSPVVDESRAVAIELPASACLFHHCLTLHASAANTSAQPRRALAITYMPAC